MASRAKAVSITELSKSIDKAVALAGKRHGVSLGDDNLVYNWEILGRLLRELGELGPSGPLDVATTIAKGAGLKGTPVATKIGRDILVGVIPMMDLRF
ncbi:MAG: hypothetical protein ACXVHQ_37590 [Solirubrobacteraceae bacterium]